MTPATGIWTVADLYQLGDGKVELVRGTLLIGGRPVSRLEFADEAARYPFDRLWTAEEVWQADGLPEGKIELVDGRMIMMPPVAAEHGWTVGNVLHALRSFAKRHNLGRVGPEIGVRLGGQPDNLTAPDVAFFSNERLARLPADGYGDEAPSLAVEVVSPNDRETEVAAKVARYGEAGTPRVWIVRPKQLRVDVHFPDGSVRVFHAGDILTSMEAGFDVDGFSLPVDEIFA
jgi:Uma2 family endonuclease